MRLTRDHRLRRSAEFRSLTSRGRRVRSRHLTLVHAESPTGLLRMGLGVSRKVGKAVIRNKLRRRIREIVRSRFKGPEGLDLLFIARPGAGALEFAQLEREIDHLLRKMR